MESLWCSCAQVHEPLELRFGVMHEVSRGIDGDVAWSQITLGMLVIIQNELVTQESIVIKL